MVCWEKRKGLAEAGPFKHPKMLCKRKNRLAPPNRDSLSAAHFAFNAISIKCYADQCDNCQYEPQRLHGGEEDVACDSKQRDR